MQGITYFSKSVYRCLRGTLTVHTQHKGPEMVSSAPLCGSVTTASPLSSVVSPSSHLAPPSGLSHHHSNVVTAPPCSLLDARAASAPSLGPRAASAPFFAPLPPPIRTPCQSRCTHVRFFPPCVARPSPFHPSAPAGMFTHLLFIF